MACFHILALCIHPSYSNYITTGTKTPLFPYCHCMDINYKVFMKGGLYKFVRQRENENSATKMLRNAAKNRITASWKCKRLRVKTGNRDFWRYLSRAREISQWEEWSTIMNAQVKDNKLRSKKCVPCKLCSDWGWLSGYFKAIHRFCNRQENAILCK